MLIRINRILGRLIIIIVFAGTNSILSAQTEGFVQNGDAAIFYRSFGQGAPVLIINGGPGMNSDGFEGLARMIADHNRVFIYDQRGTGRSTLPVVNASTISMDLMVNDIEMLRQHFNIRQWIILGHSFGGMLASYYTSIHPHRVRSLILSSSGGIDLGLLSYIRGSIDGNLTGPERDSVRLWDQRIAKGDTSYYARYRRGLNLAPAYLFGREFVPVIAQRLTQSNLTVNDLVWQDMRRIGFDCREGLEQFTGPVLIIQGAHDIVRKETALRSKSALKQSSIVIIDSASHYGWLEQPDAFCSAVLSFITMKE